MKIACISDIHGNLYALEKALKCIDTLDIDKTIFIGDAVGYIPGIQVLKRLKELGITCLRGNHENMLLNKTYTTAKDEVYLHQKTLEKLQSYNLEYIKSWPTEYYKENIAFFHASPNDHLNGYIYPDTDLSTLSSLPDDVRFCVTGHTHRPFIRTHNKTIFVNTGSIGLPRDDGRYGAFALIDTDADIAKIIRFDITTELKQSIAEFGPVHSSITDLIERRTKEKIIGDLLHD